MSNITTAQQAQIYQIVAGLFNAAPSASNLTELDSLVSGRLGGMTTQQLAETLANTSAFTVGIMGGKVTVAAQVQQLMSNFGLTYNAGTVGTTTASDYVQTWIAGQISANANLGDIAYTMVSALSDSALVAANPAFASMAATLSNKVAVAEYYSTLPGSTATSLAEMQAVLSGVTATTPVATTANLAVAVAQGTSSSGPSYTLTAAVDHITGAAVGDNFNAVYSDGHTQTLNLGDVLVGGQGVNSLNITSDTSNPASATTLVDTLWTGVSNIQNVNITTGAGAINLATGADFNGAFGAAGVTLAATTSTGPISIDMGTTPFTGAATITAVSGTGAQIITTGSGLATVTATSNGGAETITGAGLNLVTATILGAGAQTITSTCAGNVTVNAISAGIGAQNITTSNTGLATITATSALGVQTITIGAGNAIVNATSIVGAQAIATGAGNDTITAASYLGTQTITTGAGNDVIVAYSAAATGNAITVGAGHGTINLNGTGYNVTVGAAGTNYAAAANYVVTGADGGDFITFANDAASSSSVLTSLGTTSISAIEAAAVALGAHGVAYGTVSGNTYVAEDLAVGTASGSNTSLIEMLGSHTLTATAGQVTVVSPVVPPTIVYVAGGTSTVYVQTTYSVTAGGSFNGGSSNSDTFNTTYSDGGTNTFTSADVIVGGTGLGNTLNINSSITAAMTLGGNAPGTDWNAGDRGFTTLNITNNQGAGAITFNSTANFDLAFSTGHLNLTTSAGAGATSIALDGTGTGGAVYTGTATIVATASGAGAIDVLAGSGATTVNATTTAGEESANGVGLTSVTMTSNGAGVQNVGYSSTSVLVGNDANLATINVTQALIGSAGAQNIISTDASAVTVNATNNGTAADAVTITTGAGNDTVNILGTNGTTAVTITGGAGANTINLLAGHTGINTINLSVSEGGAALSITTGGTLAAGDVVSNFIQAQDVINVTPAVVAAGGLVGSGVLLNSWIITNDAAFVDTATDLGGGLVTVSAVNSLIGSVTSSSATSTGFVAIQTNTASNVWDLFEVITVTGPHAPATLGTTDTIQLVGTFTASAGLVAANFHA